MSRRSYRVAPAGRRAASRWVVGCHPIEDHIAEEPWNYNLVVPEPEPEWLDTGLVDPHGDPIMRPNRVPMGFLWEFFPEE